jgi:protein-tyrosine-phosphatase
MANILVVCTANICRSPLAAAELRRRIQGLGLSDWQVDSAGTWAIVPREPSEHSARVAELNGLDISEHRAQSVSAELLDNADLILCMTANHKESLQVEFGNAAEKIWQLSEMTGRVYDVSDPYGGPYQGYVRLWETLSRLYDQGLEQIVTLAATNAGEHPTHTE